MKRIIAILAMFGLVIIGTGFVASPADAHVPNHTASCSGVTGGGTSYKKGDTVTVTVGSTVKSDKANKDGSMSATVAVPQDGEVYDWSVVINSVDDQFDFTYTGTVGPCGDTDTDVKKIEFCHYDGSNENGGSGKYSKIETSVSAFFNAGHIDHVNDIWPAFDYKKQGKSYHVDAQGDQSLLQYDKCVAPPAPTCETAPSPELCPQPPAEHRNKTVVGEPDCDTHTVTTEVHHYTIEYVWVDDAWVKGEETEDEGSPEVSTRDTTPEECPVVIPDVATATVVTTPATCDEDGTASIVTDNASVVSDEIFGINPHQHKAVVEAAEGAEFAPADNVSEDGRFMTIVYSVPAATGDCPKPPSDCDTHCGSPLPPHNNVPPNDNPPSPFRHLPNAGLDDTSAGWTLPLGIVLLLAGLGIAASVLWKRRA